MSRLSPLHAPARTLGVALSAVTKWLAATSLALVTGGSLAAQATLTSDQADYQPGTTATLTGAGFEAGESVRLQVLHDDGTPGTGADHDPWYVDADASGGFVTTWHVCEDDCVGSALIATADGQSSARHAEAYFTDAVGTGWVSVSSSTHCVDSTDPQGRGPGNWEVRQGGTYVMTLSGVTECTGDTITVFVQNSSSGNFCFNATRMAPGVYAGAFTMPNPACNTFPISYKCGANAPCDNDSTWAARYFSDGRDNTVHLRAANFDANCNATSTDTNCAPDCVPCTLVCPPDLTVDCGSSTAPASTGMPGGCTDASYTDSVTAGACAGSYVITRTWTASDGCGGSSSCTQRITVQDSHGPSLTCPGDVSLDCSESTDPSRTGSASATDDCSGVADIRYSDSTTAGSCAGNYVIARTWTATDGCGNSTSCTQTLTVSDTHAPSLLCPPDITVSAGGACCVPVDLGTPTVSDDCSGTQVSNDAPAQFCVGDTTVTWTATDGCGNASTCTQTVRVLGQICASKFYDANANGVRDPEEVGVEGWKMIVTGTASFVGYTDASGSVCFDVPAGTYEVAEGLALETNWVGTTAPSCTVVIDSGHCTATCEFGNYCFRAPSNGFTLGFWSNKNGQAILSLNDASSPSWREVVNGLNLRNANGTFFTVPTTGSFNAAYSGFRSWLLNATATNMAYMLSAQLAATTLDTKYRGLSNAQAIVVPGGVKTNAGVCIVPFLSASQAISCGTPPLLSLTAIPGSTACGCSSNDGLVTIGDLRARAICLLGAYGTTVSASTQRTYQECVKCLLDMINNNGGAAGYPCGGLSQYLNSTDDSCPATF